jgi:NAD(P)-dependent dehydrogenase (short-subunit alcohol dehydrogenase family)
MVEYLAAHGAKMAVLARNKQKGDELVAKIKSKGGDAIFVQTDVTDEAVLKQNADQIIATYGRIDVLINGAGGNMPGAIIGPDNTIFDLKIDDFRKVVDLNLMGTVIPTLIFAENMVKTVAETLSTFLPSRHCAPSLVSPAMVQPKLPFRTLPNIWPVRWQQNLAKISA